MLSIKCRKSVFPDEVKGNQYKVATFILLFFHFFV